MDGGPNLVELVSEMWTKMRAAVFEIKEYYVDNVNIVLDMVFSGEYGTLVINNVTNESNLSMILVEIERKLSFLERFFYKVMGDDSVTIWRLNRMIKQSEYNQIATTLVDISKSNGLGVSIGKTVIRRFMYEYLKKMGLYGFVIPRKLQMTPLSKENVNQSISYREQLVGLKGYLTEAVSRGFTHSYMVKMGLLMGLLKNRLKLGQKDFYNLPVSLMFAPISLGGGGFRRKTLIGPNNDILSRFYSSDDRWMLNKALFESPVEKDVKRSIYEQMRPHFDNGVNFVTDSIKNNYHTNQILFHSMESSDYLKAKGYNVGELGYYNYPNRALKDIIMQNPTTQELASEFRKVLFSTIKRLNPIKPKVINIEVPHNHLYHVLNDKRLVDYLIFKSTDEIGDIYTHDTIFIIDLLLDDVDDMFDSTINKFLEHQPGNVVENKIHDMSWWFDGIYLLPIIITTKAQEVCPVAGLDDVISDLIKHIGCSGEADFDTFNLSTQLNRITSQKFFPKDITVEKLYNILNDPIFDNADDVTHLFVSLGSSIDIAASVATEIMSTLLTFKFKNTVKTYSTRDQIIGHMDLSLNNIKRLINCDVLDSLPKLKNAVYGVAILDILTTVDVDYINCLFIKIPKFIKSLIDPRLNCVNGGKFCVCNTHECDKILFWNISIRESMLAMGYKYPGIMVIVDGRHVMESVNELSEGYRNMYTLSEYVVF